MKNNDLEISVQNPEEIEHRLFYRLEENWREIKLINYKKIFRNLDFSFNYFIETDYARSDTFAVEIFEIPSIRKTSLKYIFPKYTKLKSEFINDSNGSIKALKHTFVVMNIEANNTLTEAKILFSDGRVINMDRIGKSKFEIKFKLEKSGNYSIQLTDFLGNTSEKINKQIIVLSDEKPEIKIIYPAKDTVLTQNYLFPLKFFANDDFGLKNLQLNYFLNGGEATKKMLKTKITSTNFDFEYIFDLNNFNLIPGDKLTYWAEISDNSPELQTSFSNRYILRLPSIEEIYQELENQGKEQEEVLKENLEKSKELNKTFEDKRREMMKKEEFDWDDKKDLEKILENQKELNQEIEKMAEDYKELVEKFSENNALSDETLEKMEKIKELMEEISNDQLQEAMEKMQEQMEKMDEKSLKKAMEEFKFSMEDYQEKLEQTIDLLESIKKEQNMQKALEIAQEMQEMQEDLNEKSSSENADSEKLAKEQDKISEKLSALEKQLEKTDEMLDPSKDSDVKEKMDELQEQMEKDDLDSDLSESSEKMKNDQMKQAQKSQKSASKKMSKMTQKLQEMQKMMSAGSSMDIGNAIQDAMKRLMYLSGLQKKSAEQYVNDPFLILTDQFAVFEGMDLTLSKLYSTPMVVLALHPKFIYDSNFTKKSFQKMFDYINDAKKQKVKNYLKDIKKGLNLMIYDLIQSASNMNNSSGSGGGMQSMMQQMQEMGEQQMAMNMLTQQMMQQMGQNGKISNEMRQQMQEMAGNEARMAENLKRMLQNHPDAQKNSSALNKIIEELDEISRLLRSNRMDRNLLDRQERILSRLLDAQKSIHKREFSKKRKAETAEKNDWELPEEIKLKFDKMRKDALLKEDFRNYPKEYQEIIKKYLRLLNEKANKSEMRDEKGER